MDLMPNIFKDLRVEPVQDLSARERILRTAIILFNRDGIQATGIDRIIAEADVAKMTLYKHFPSKADLVAAYLEFKDQARNSNLLKHTTLKTDDPLQQILGIFDSLEDWFREPDFRGCPFVRGLYEFNASKDLQAHAQVTKHFARIGKFVEDRVRHLVKGRQIAVCRDQILSLIVGTVIMALATGNASIAQTNKKLAGAMLRLEA